MMKTMANKGWSPYVAGALTGVVMIFSVLVAGKYFGASTTFVRSAGMLEKIFSAERVSKIDYFVKEAPKIDWQWMFVVGILIGCLIASTTSKTFQWKAVPHMYLEASGSSYATSAR